MQEFTPNTEIVTDAPTLVVQQRLAPGRYRFQLVVEDDHGIRSDPATVEVQVVAPPVAVIEARPGTTVRVGDSVTLDGSKSTDPSGRITRYHWSLVAATGGTDAPPENRGRDR